MLIKNFLVAAAILFSANTPAERPIRVVTTTSDMQALVRAVGGAGVEVFSLARGSQDPHQLEAKPSFMVRLRDSEAVIAQGLELESAWLEPLIQGARNPKLQRLELGSQLNPLEVHSEPISRSEGDVHPLGNPHFQLDPERMGRAAGLVAEFLATLRPTQKEMFRENAKNFQARLDKKMMEWRRRVKASGQTEVVTFHKTFAYFCAAFNIRCELSLEPKPGIPPSASHLLQVIKAMRERNIRLVLIENYFDDGAVERLQTSLQKVKVVKVPVAVDGAPNLQSTEQVIENLVKVIEASK